MSLTHITLDNIDKLVHSLPIFDCGETTITLALMARNLDIKTPYEKRELQIPIRCEQLVPDEELFTTEGFLRVANETLYDNSLYLANVTFLGYKGILRYPAIKGILYEQKWK